jgi:predicted dehydrogenase
MLKLGIIGLGQWGQHLVQSIQGKSERVRFVSGYSTEPDAVAGFAQRHCLRLTAEYADILADPELPAVVIATPHSRHLQHIVEVCKSGKHVFVEKPLALTRRDAEQARKACSEAEVGLFVGYNWRFQPALIALADIVRGGGLGEICHIEGNYSGPSAFRRTPGSWRTLRSESPAGGMTGRGIHVLNAMNLLCGPITSVFAYNDRKAAPYDLEDTTSALLRFTNGVTGYVGACQVTAEFWRLQVFGVKGWAEMRMEHNLTTCLIDGAPESKTFPAIVPEFFELEAFADAIKGNCFSVQAVQDAIDGVALLEAIERSARIGRQIEVEQASP